MPHRIPATLKQFQALEALGIAVPLKLCLGFPSHLLEGKVCTPAERALDADYQRPLDVWVSQIECLYSRQVPQKTMNDVRVHLDRPEV